MRPPLLPPPPPSPPPPPPPPPPSPPLDHSDFPFKTSGYGPTDKTSYRDTSTSTSKKVQLNPAITDPPVLRIRL